METVQKLALVDPRILEPLQNKQPPTVLSNLDKEMQHILRQKISDEEKIALYQQILQKYLFFKNKIETTPIQITVQEPLEKHETNKKEVDLQKEAGHKEVVKQEPNNRTLMENSVLSSLPKTLKAKGKILLNSIQHSSDLHYTDSGQVLYQGEPIPNVNLYDLMHDLLRKKKQSDLASIQKLTMGLKEANIPRSLIGNKAHLKRLFPKQCVHY